MKFGKRKTKKQYLVQVKTDLGILCEKHFMNYHKAWNAYVGWAEKYSDSKGFKSISIKVREVTSWKKL